MPPAAAPADLFRWNALRRRPAAPQLESPRLPHAGSASAFRGERHLARGRLRRMDLGAGVGALRLPLPSGDPSGGAVAARAGHLALAGGLGGGPAVALAEQPFRPWRRMAVSTRGRSFSTPPRRSSGCSSSPSAVPRSSLCWSGPDPASSPGTISASPCGETPQCSRSPRSPADTA